MNLGPISLRSLSTACTRSLEAVGLLVSAPMGLSTVPDMVDWLGGCVERRWEDVSGVGLEVVCGEGIGVDTPVA